MKITAWLTTWIGLALIALLGWVIPWMTIGNDSGALMRGADAVRDEPNRAGLDAIPGFYVTHGWVIIAGLLAAFATFAMFTARGDKWIAVLGYLAGAAALGFAAYRLITASERSSNETLLLYVAIGVAVVMLLMMVLSFRRAAFIGAIPAALLALIGLGWSIWLLLGSHDGPLALSWRGWGLPLAHFLVLVGALLAIAVAGRNKTADPPTARPGRTTDDAPFAATPPSAAV